MLGRLIARTGDEGPVELGKLEALCAALEGQTQRSFAPTVSPHPRRRHGDAFGHETDRRARATSSHGGEKAPFRPKAPFTKPR